MTVEQLLDDLISRTQAAVATIAGISGDIQLHFEMRDIVDTVERGLPDDYPMPDTGAGTRRQMIERIAVHILTGE
jgi:hypothetical protein